MKLTFHYLKCPRLGVRVEHFEVIHNKKHVLTHFILFGLLEVLPGLLDIPGSAFSPKMHQTRHYLPVSIALLA